MVDARSRGGKKAGTGRKVNARHQGTGTTKPRAPRGAPGGPKAKAKSGRGRRGGTPRD